MTIEVGSPAALLLLAVAPVFVGTARRRALGAGLCRAAAWCVLAVVLAEPYLVRDRPESGVCVVAATDVSASVGDAAAGAARRLLADVLPRLGASDVVGAVAFAAHPSILATPAGPDVRPLDVLVPDPTTAPAATADREDTDIGAALATATALCPAGKQPAVLLSTDGNETAGHVLAEAALADAAAPVFPVVPPATSLPAVAMRRLLVPASAPAGLFVPVEAVVEAREAMSVAVALEVDGRAPPARPVDLRPGLSVVALPLRPVSAGTARLAARLLTAPGAPRATGVARAALEVTRPLLVLWVTERTTPPVAVQALVEHGVDVALTTPAALAARVARLDEVDVVVLDDVGHRVLPDGPLEAIGRWVAAGGGLVVTGGEHLFGDAGFAGGPLERLLPVELVAQRPEPEEREPLALELVIDRSNSMGVAGADGGTKMDYARRAALAVLEQLAPSDVVGAVAFDDQARELSAPRPVAEQRAALAARIRALRHGGGTDFLDALDLARRRLLAESGRIRHVILLTDGDTNRRTPDHFGLIDDLVRADVSVTTLRIGADVVNLQLLGTIARATGGEFHHVERLETLPQLLIQDTQQQRAVATGRRGARAHIVADGPMLAGIAERDVPPLTRWARTRARRDAEVRLAVDVGTRRDPLLATWGWQLGRVAVLPVDFQAGGASWAVWRDFGKLWTQLVRWTATATRSAGARTAAVAGDDAGLAREGRAVGADRALLERLAAATGGRVDPTAADVLHARAGRARESRPVGTWLLPLAMALVVADVALRRGRSRSAPSP